MYPNGSKAILSNAIFITRLCLIWKRGKQKQKGNEKCDYTLQFEFLTLLAKHFHTFYLFWKNFGGNR